MPPKGVVTPPSLPMRPRADSHSSSFSSPPPEDLKPPSLVPAGVPVKNVASADASMDHGGAVPREVRPAPQAGGKHWETKRKRTHGILDRLFAKNEEKPKPSSSSSSRLTLSGERPPSTLSSVSSSSSSAPSIPTSSSSSSVASAAAPSPFYEESSPSVESELSLADVRTLLLLLELFSLLSEGTAGGCEGVHCLPEEVHSNELTGKRLPLGGCLYLCVVSQHQCRRCKKSFCGKCSKKTKGLSYALEFCIF